MIIWRFPLLCFFSISFGTELVVTQKFLAAWFGGINWSCFIFGFFYIPILSICASAREASALLRSNPILRAFLPELVLQLDGLRDGVNLPHFDPVNDQLISGVLEV